MGEYRDIYMYRCIYTYIERMMCEDVKGYLEIKKDDEGCVGFRV